MRKIRVQSAAMIALAWVLLLALAPAAGAQEEIDPLIPREAMVRLDPGFSIDDFNAQQGTTTLKSIESRNIHLVRIPDGAVDSNQWADQVMDQSPAGLDWAEGLYAGQDGEGRTGSFFVSGIDARQDYLDQYVRTQQGVGQIHQTTRGQDVVVAILDTGVDATHEVLAPLVLPGGFNFVDNNSDTADVGDGADNDGDGFADESVGHGTFVAGLVALMAPEAGILPVKVLNSDGHADNFTFAQGAFYAIDQGADVINMSLGSTYDSLAVLDAVAEAKLRGIVVVGAAGNQDTNSQEKREYPALFDSNVLGVVSVDENDIKSEFSNYNQRAALAAPGSGGIFSTIPETPDGHTYAEWKGTSFATGLVSGAAALVLSANPDWPDNVFRWAQVHSLLTGTAFNIDPLNPAYAGELGAGRIDALAAVNGAGAGNTVAIYDFEVPTGTLLDGGLFSINEDEDGRFIHLRSGFGRSFAELHKSELLIKAIAIATNATILDMRFVARIDQPSGTAKVQLRNWSTGRFEQVLSYPIGTTAQRVDVEVPNPARFISENGEVEMLIKHVVFAPFFAFTFESFHDKIDIELE